MVKTPELSDEQKLAELERQKKQEEWQREQEKKSPYRANWAQYNLEHTMELMSLTAKAPKARMILDFLTQQMDTQNAVICSYRVLEEVIGVSSETIRKNLKILRDGGFIATFKSGTSNVYAVNDSIYWKSYGKNIWQSKFPANVILSLSEQDKETQQKVMKEKLTAVNMKPEKPTKKKKGA